VSSIEIVQTIERIQQSLRLMKVRAELSHVRRVEEIETMVDALKHKIGGS
jgi:hypothetical protein